MTIVTSLAQQSLAYSANRTLRDSAIALLDFKIVVLIRALIQVLIQHW